MMLLYSRGTVRVTIFYLGVECVKPLYLGGTVCDAIALKRHRGYLLSLRNNSGGVRCNNLINKCGASVVVHASQSKLG